MRPDENKKRHIVVCGKSGGGSGEQVQADWNQTDSEQPDYIKNKPTIPAAQVQSDWNQSDNTQVDYIKNKPTILTQWFGTKQEYDAILVKDPNVIYNIEGTDNVQADWNQSDSSADDYIKNKPTIPAAQVNSDWNAVSGVAQILNKPTIPTVPPMNIETVRFTMQGGVIRSVDFYVMPQENNYFYVEDVSGSNNTLYIDPNGSLDIPIFEVFSSTDMVNWTSLGTTGIQTTAQIPTNGRLYLKAVTDSWVSGFEGSIIYANGNHNVGGNIMSLLYGDNFRGQTTFPEYSQGNFMSLFSSDTTLISAENLVLPATTLNGWCYNAMFHNCTSLTTAPALPATTLADSCYNFMFRGCASLTTAPVLPATTLAEGCYGDMFNGCTSLNTVTTYANDISATDCITDWLDNVSAQGNFFNLGSPAPTYPSGGSGIPSGWTEHNSL